MADTLDIISVSFQASLDFVPIMREFVSDTLLTYGCTDKFAYRSEIIVDELCSNSIKYGCENAQSRVEVKVEIANDSVSINVIDEGYDAKAVDNMKRLLSQSSLNNESSDKLGLGIIKMLSKSVEVVRDDNVTNVKVISSIGGNQ